MPSDEYFMAHASANALTALQNGFSPVGAVVVDADTGQLLISTGSQRKPGNILHAEFLALLEYESGDKHDNVTLYTTLEPCIMCMGMAVVLRIKRIVWLVDDHWGGSHAVYDKESVYTMQRFPKLERLDNTPLLKRNCIQFWVEYLEQNGDARYIPLMLGDQYATQGTGEDDR